MSTFVVSLDGYTDLPPGKIANVVTFLERTEAPGSLQPLPQGLALVHVADPSPAWYRTLYRRIGENWLWFSRAIMPEDELAALISSPSTVILALERDGEAIGLVELDSAIPGKAEIVTFGVVPGETGTGAAKVLMDGALAQAFSGNVRRVWLHTCTFDHPAAVRFYVRQGFRAFKFAIEVSDDPRALGFLPASAAPHVPMLGPAKRPRGVDRT
jgi:GNAT superfamily N-acetyltransferase